jgi:hypothetical protein
MSSSFHAVHRGEKTKEVEKESVSYATASNSVAMSGVPMHTIAVSCAEYLGHHAFFLKPRIMFGNEEREKGQAKALEKEQYVHRIGCMMPHRFHGEMLMGSWTGMDCFGPAAMTNVSHQCREHWCGIGLREPPARLLGFAIRALLIHGNHASWFFAHFPCGSMCKHPRARDQVSCIRFIDAREGYVLTQLMDFLPHIILFVFPTHDRHDAIGLDGGQTVGIRRQGITDHDLNHIEQMVCVRPLPSARGRFVLCPLLCAILMAWEWLLRTHEAPGVPHTREPCRPMKICDLFLGRPLLGLACEAIRTGGPILSFCRERMGSCQTIARCHPEPLYCTGCAEPIPRETLQDALGSRREGLWITLCEEMRLRRRRLRPLSASTAKGHPRSQGFLVTAQHHVSHRWCALTPTSEHHRYGGGETIREMVMILRARLIDRRDHIEKIWSKKGLKVFCNVNPILLLPR